MYVLRLKISRDKFEILNSLFENRSKDKDRMFWEYEIEENDINYFNSISIFISKIEKNRIYLQEIGVRPEDFTIWLFYEYDQQCNLEFTPDDLKKMGDNKITFCISCWPK